MPQSIEMPHNIDDINLNMTQIENLDPINDTDESKNPLEIKPEPISKKSQMEKDKKGLKNKDLSLSDLILDSSFLSPGTGSKLKYEEFGLKNLRKEENCAAEHKKHIILIEESSSSNNKSLENSPDSQNFQKTMITNQLIEPKTMDFIEEEEKKYDEILSQMKEKIRKEKEKLSFSQKQMSLRKTQENALKLELSDKTGHELIKITHNKHNSEIFRSTPNGSFLNNLNSNSETKLSANIENNSSLNAKMPEKFRNHSISCLGTQKTNIFRRILKKKPLQTNNSLFFSNQTQTKLMTADFNKEIGFLQNIICFKDEEAGSGRSEPIIIACPQGGSNNFSKFLNNKENSKFHNSEISFNCSFPGGRTMNKNKKQIFVRQFVNENRKRKTRSINKSLELNEALDK